MSTDLSSENIKIIDFGVSDYAETLARQLDLFGILTESKKSKEKIEKEYILIGEHKPVYTLGRRGKESNFLISEKLLSEKGIQVFKIERGGDVTYHAPGQLIVYPILDLEKHHLGVKDYVNLLEEAVIRLLAKYNIKGERVEGATGVWIDKGKTTERKICAIGIKCSRYCSMHGLALNINTDLTGFSYINPCGFTDKGVTSLKEEGSQIFDMNKIKEEFLDIFLGLIFPL